MRNQSKARFLIGKSISIFRVVTKYSPSSGRETGFLSSTIVSIYNLIAFSILLTACSIVWVISKI